jgi:hypothetical protein
MSEHSEDFELSEAAFAERPATDDRAPLAIASGLVAALVAGGLWALLASITGLEIGYAAWGVGLLVGLAMNRITRQRSQRLAYTAAALALIGLSAGKVFIFLGSAGPVAKELVGDDEMLKSGVAWQMYYARELDAPTLEELDRTREAGDTLSDAVWARMQEQASSHLAAMTPEQKQEAATALARSFMQEMGIIGGVKAQLSLFDLLWVFLAVGTAYRLLAPMEPVPEPQPA